MATWYVSPSGTDGAAGTIGAPISLKKAVSSTSPAGPGDTVYLRGGTYTFANPNTHYDVQVNGSVGARITFRSYPGEWATVDGNLSYTTDKNHDIFQINGDYLTFENFEITNSEIASRSVLSAESYPAAVRPDGVADYATGTKLINLVIHDVGQGLGSWMSSASGEYYGNIIYNIGYDAPDRIHGHITYIQHELAQTIYRNNIFFNAFAYAFHAYGSSTPKVKNLLLEKNVLFNSDSVLSSAGGRSDFVYNENKHYKSGANFGYDDDDYTKSTELDITDNYFVQSDVSLYRQNTGMLTFTGNSVITAGMLVLADSDNWSTLNANYNTYYKDPEDDTVHYVISATNTGKHAFSTTAPPGEYAANGNRTWNSSGTNARGQDNAGTHYNTAKPSVNQVFVEPNDYDANRATVTIFNHENSTSVSITPPSEMGLVNGDTYQLRNVQDYFVDIIEGTYNGTSISVPMTGRTKAEYVGESAANNQLTAGQWYHKPTFNNTFPAFGVFVLEKTSESAETVTLNIWNFGTGLTQVEV